MKTIRSRRRLRIREPAAFTLIEVLVTLVILSTGIVLVLQAFETSLVALGDARDNLWGSFLMRQKMTEVELAFKTGSTPSSSSERFEVEPYRGFRCDREIMRIGEVKLGSSGTSYGLFEVSSVVGKPGAGLHVSGTTWVISPDHRP